MSTPVAGPMQCARHPKVETGLACGRCETPICPKCMVMTDVGARCPDCAPRRRLHQFEVSPLYVIRGAVAALAVGSALGLAWGLLLPGDYGLLLGLLVGAGLGYCIGEGVSLATNRKSGALLQTAAGTGMLLAYIIRNLLWVDEVLPSDDLYGYVALTIGIIMAAARLRF